MGWEEARSCVLPRPTIVHVCLLRNGSTPKRALPSIPVRAFRRYSKRGGGSYSCSIAGLGRGWFKFFPYPLPGVSNGIFACLKGFLLTGTDMKGTDMAYTDTPVGLVDSAVDQGLCFYPSPPDYSGDSFATHPLLYRWKPRAGRGEPPP